MMNIKKTLRELHKKFPEFTLEQLFDILDCIEEENTQGMIDHIQLPNQITTKPDWTYRPDLIRFT